mmetsp:Transcript_21159/g.64444  ORF Transcript_21159/g.64444 Transcript_21159/m.64444 type:complete len:101 (-) Transcript_21159:226-528(-)
MVVANELESRYRELMLVFPGAEAHVAIGGDEEIEVGLCAAVAEEHGKFAAAAGAPLTLALRRKATCPARALRELVASGEAQALVCGVALGLGIAFAFSKS